MMKYLILLIFLIGCGQDPKKAYLSDGKYFFSHGVCGNETSIGHQIDVSNSEALLADLSDVRYDIDNDVIYIDCSIGSDVYVWEGRY